MSERNMEITIDGRRFRGTIEYSEEDGCYHGRVLDTKDLITYEGANLAILVDSFTVAAEEYVEFCVAHNKELLPISC